MLTESFARQPEVWVLGNFPPRRCGIATFTCDLADAVQANGMRCRVAAMDDGSGVEYDNRVELLISQDDLAAYIEAADVINRSRASAVLIQHEYGIFGGEAGGHLVTLLRFLELPVVTTLHTVLERPTEAQRWVMEEILSRSERVVVMSRRAKDILRRCYGRDDNVEIIPHGVPAAPPIGRSSAKRELGWDGRKVILTFGLLSPDKGIEVMIDAMRKVVDEHPDALYVIAGQTHPHIKRDRGEAYRESLEMRSLDLGLENNVSFVNRFTDLEELCTMLTACDLYVTPYLKLEQITSGTLSYAVGMGRCVVSTPYWHAEELLPWGPGRLVPPREVEPLAEAIGYLLSHDEERFAHEAAARKVGAATRWPHIGAEYLRVVADVWKPIHASAFANGSWSKSAASHPLPIKHLLRLTDDCGIYQHAKYDIPNRNEGYCTDDNARALLVLWSLPESALDRETFERLERTYLGFMHFAWNAESGAFRNFMSAGREWLDESGSADCQGRALMALARGAFKASTSGRRQLCADLFQEASESLGFDGCPRYAACRLLAAVEWARGGGAEEAIRSADEFAQSLLEVYQAADSDFPWFEPVLSYDNARLPQALIEWGAVRRAPELVETGLRSLEWLCQQQVHESEFAPIGSDGFWRKGARRALFDQQPIEAWATIEACVAAQKVSPKPIFRKHADLAMNWFFGGNVCGCLMVDSETGACCDGLGPSGPNLNKGAESGLAFLGSAVAYATIAEREKAAVSSATLL